MKNKNKIQNKFYKNSITERLTIGEFKENIKYVKYK